MRAAGKRGTRRLLSVAAAVTLAAAASHAAAARGSVLLSSRTTAVAGLAMDGDEVAIADTAPTRVSLPFPPWSALERCDRVDLVDVRGGAPVRLSRNRPAYYCDGGAFGGTPRGESVALAGSRAFWIYRDPGNFLYQSLLTAAPGSAERTMIAATPAGADPDLGPFLGPVAASGTSLAYSTYRVTRTCRPTGECVFSPPRDTTLTLRGGRVALPAPGRIVASVDSGRAAVLLADGRAAVVTRRAPALIARGGPHTATSAAIAGRWLVTLAANRLWAYDAATARLHGSFPARGALHVDSWAGIAVYTTRRQIVAIRLSNGHRRLMQQVAPHRAFIGGAEVEAGGIVWATAPAQSTDRPLNLVWRLPLPSLR